MNLPNKLTITRLILVAVFAVFAFPYPDVMENFIDGTFFDIIRPYIALIVYIVASITDAVDGHIARRDNLITDFGKFLDPIADKLLVSAALLALCNVSLMYLWAALIILAREFVVSGIRMLAASKGTVIAAGKLGKLKMIFQTIAIITILVAGIVPTGLWSGFEIIQEIIYILGNIVMVAAVLLTIISGVEYVIKNKEVLSIDKK
ncbi:MAG: CDP-diacylglycerol--glycerol-3-phosphate 3-phosphatidyltransferase [Ruminococcaceae bacterium]|nr:CDP-diacylglycerol--glycerol-3-phosphate 3-phosphatidyltransferase [Oscillospiraceae bacterium]